MGQQWSFLNQDHCCCSNAPLDPESSRRTPSRVESRVESKQALACDEPIKQEVDAVLDQESAKATLEVAIVLYRQGRHAEAEPLFRMALWQSEQQFGEDHEMTVDCLGHLADCLCDQGKFELAEPHFRKAVRLGDQVAGVTHPNIIRYLRKLHLCLCKMGKDWEAKEIEKRLDEFGGGGNKGGPKPSRISFKAGLSLTDVSVSEVVNIVLITDVGQDSDDEMALLLAAQLIKQGEINLLAVIANLNPSNRRAALARGTLDMLGLHHVPVGIGTDGGSQKHTDTFSEYISVGKTGVNYFSDPLGDVTKVLESLGIPEEDAVSQDCRIWDGQKLIRKTLEEANDMSVSLLLVSSLKDAGLFLRDHEQLFAKKVHQVTMMGGAQPVEVGKDLDPSDAHNNVFDMPAAQLFYQRCQKLGVPITVLSRFAAYGCPLQKKVYDLMVRCPVPNPVVCRLQRAQRVSIENLWSNVCEGGILPARCDKQWFCNTFCGGEGADRNKDDSMWILVKTFNMYDPLALLAAIPSRRKQFFTPESHVSSGGAENLLIGTSPESSGISPDSKEDLHDFLMTTWIRAAGRPRGGAIDTGEQQRPVELDAEQLTAALTPMSTHSPEELRELNRNVLSLIDNEWPKLKNTSFLDTWRVRDRLMRQIGPPMVLMDPDTLLRLGRIPHSAEDKAITMEHAAGLAEKEGQRFFIEMFSHRWHSQYAPDDRYHNKARVLVEWAKYRRKSMNIRTFFWIDYVCINQSDIKPGVSMLPLYVSCCNNIVCYDTPPYEPRAWCRVERLMFVSFVAPNTEYVSPDFTYDENAEVSSPNGELKPAYEGRELVPNPSANDSLLSYPQDAELITELKELCTQHWAKCWKDGLMDTVEKKGGLKEVRKLRYGGSEVRVRKF